MWWVLRALLVGLLICTALAKVVYAQQLLHGGGMLASRWMLSGAVGAELAIATLIWTCRPLVAHRIAMVTFSCLGFVAGMAWLTGSDCNCFGPRTLSGLPAVIDGACLLGLILARRSAQDAASAPQEMQSRRLVRLFWPLQVGHQRNIFVSLGSSCAAAAAGITITWAATGHTAHQPGEIPSWFGENLIGSDFPLLQFPMARSLTPAGEKRLFVLLRPDCEHCQEFAQRWNDGPPSGIAPHQIIGVAIEPAAWVLMPGEVSANAPPHTHEYTLEWGKISEPFVATPTLIAVDGGRVSSVVSGDNADAMLDSVAGMSAMFAAGSESAVRP